MARTVKNGEVDKIKKHFLFGPIIESFFILVLMLMILLAVIQIVIPNNWISINNACMDIFSNFNNTRWYGGGYSQEEVDQVNNCYRLMSSK
jgi:hypothetical protein